MYLQAEIKTLWSRSGRELADLDLQCFEEKNKPRFSMEVVNIHLFLWSVDSKIHENRCKQKI